jgi:hypothetical protein
VCTFTYLLIGAAVFDALESGYESEYKRKYLDREMFFKDLYNITNEEYDKLRINIWKSMPYKSARQWKFPDSVSITGTGSTTSIILPVSLNSIFK